MATGGGVAEGAELEQLLESSKAGTTSKVGRLHTDGERKQYALEVHQAKNSRRSKTDPDTLLATSNITDPVAFGKKLFKKIVRELDQEQLRTNNMHFKSYKWLMPGEQTTPEHLVLHDEVYSQAMTVSNDELSQIIRMELSTDASPPTALGHHFYIRSWQLTPTQLGRVIDYLTQHEMQYEETDAWREVLDKHHLAHASAPQNYTIRYAGTVQGPRRPIDRFTEDWKGRNSGILIDFMRAVEEICPEVALAGQAHLLPAASLATDSFLQPDDIERVLIQYLHYPTLLNRQRGGFYASYVPPAEDADVFRGLKTDFWSKFGQHSSMPPAEMLAQVASHFEDVQQYASANPTETGTSKHEFTDELRNVCQEEATPFQYHGETVITFIGKDQTYEGYRSPSPFIKGNSRAGYLTRDFIYRLVRWEAQAAKRDFQEGSFNPRFGPWCFVDLWPWLWHRNLPRATEFLQWYLAFARPIIAATYSRPVNEVTLANFQHGNGVKMNGFTSIVGIPTIQYHDIDDESGKPIEDSAFINIPHIHPGRDKYVNEEPRLRRMLDLTMQYTFLVAHVTLEILDEHAKAPKKVSRKELCEEILDRVESICAESAPHIRFLANLEQAREDLLQHWASVSNKQAMRLPTTQANKFVSPLEERRVLDVDGRAKIASLGQARGPPDSAVRRDQLEQLWEKNMPDLHTTIPHADKHRTHWIAFMAAVPQHQYYYLYVLSLTPPDPGTTGLLENFRPDSATGEDWMQDHKARREAAVAAGVFVDECRQTDDSAEQVGERNPDVFLKPSQCQGRTLKVFANGKFTVRWIDDDKSRVTTRLLCKPAKSKTSAARYLQFTELGIDVVGPNLKRFGPILLAGKEADVSIAINSLVNEPKATQLWKKVCTAHGITVAALEDTVDDAVEWGKRQGVPALATNAPSETIKQNRPPKRLDAIWLLNEFINQTPHLANGGTFRTATKDKFDDSTEDLQHFVDFIKQPAYAKHPFTAWWRQLLDVDKPQVTVLGKNLPMLRHSVTGKQDGRTPKDPTTGKTGHIQERYFTLGAQGSALPNPFAAGSGQSCISEYAQKKQKKEESVAAESEAGSSKQSKKVVTREAEDLTATVEALMADNKGKKGGQKGGKKGGKKSKADDDVTTADVEAEVETGAKKAGKKRGKKAKDVDEETEVAAEATLSTKKKGKKAQVAVPDPDVADDDDEEPGKKRNRKKKVPVVVEEEEEEVVVVAEPKKRKREQADDDYDGAEAPPTAPRPIKKSKRRNTEAYVSRTAGDGED